MSQTALADIRCLADIVRVHSARRGDAVAVECAGRSHTFSEFYERAQTVAGALAAAGVGDQDRVAVIEHNGIEVLEVVSENTFDLIFMDIQMPDMDGFTATAALREQEKYDGGHIPIVAMTAHAMKGDSEKCLAAGMDGYVSKPIDRARLFEVITQVTGSVAQPV